MFRVFQHYTPSLYTLYSLSNIIYFLIHQQVFISHQLVIQNQSVVKRNQQRKQKKQLIDYKYFFCNLSVISCVFPSRFLKSCHFCILFSWIAVFSFGFDVLFLQLISFTLCHAIRDCLPFLPNLWFYWFGLDFILIVLFSMCWFSVEFLKFKCTGIC